MTEEEEEAKRIFGLASDEYDADIFFYSGEIDDDGLGKLIGAITNSKSRRNALLILVTNGGSANSAYQIARFFHKVYYDGKFILFVPSFCKSAGTLIALGAHSLIMDTFSELGPLDVQLLKQDEIGTRKSGLLSRSSFQALEEASFELFESLMLKIKQRSNDLISFRLASDVSARITAELMVQVYGQISPDVVGGDYRDLQVALHYGVRLVGYSENATPATVKHLVEHYPSHDFVIDDVEASTLFRDVSIPSGTLYAIIDLLGDAAYNEDRSGIVMALDARIDQTGKNEDASEIDGSDHPAPGSEPSGMDADWKEDRTSNSETSGSAETGEPPLHSAREKRRQAKSRIGKN